MLPAFLLYVRVRLFVCVLRFPFFVRSFTCWFVLVWTLLRLRFGWFCLLLFAVRCLLRSRSAAVRLRCVCFSRYTAFTAGCCAVCVLRFCLLLRYVLLGALRLR